MQGPIAIQSGTQTHLGKVGSWRMSKSFSDEETGLNKCEGNSNRRSMV